LSNCNSIQISLV